MSADSTVIIILYIKIACGPAEKLNCKNAGLGIGCHKLVSWDIEIN